MAKLTRVCLSDALFYVLHFVHSGAVNI